MAKPTQKEIDEWNARMAEPDEPDPDDFEVILFDNDGNPVGTMPFTRAKAYFAKRGIDLDIDDAVPNGNAAPGGTGQSGNNAGQSGGMAPPARPSSKYFARGGTAQSQPGTIPPNTGQPGAIPDGR